MFTLRLTTYFEDLRKNLFNIYWQIIKQNKTQTSYDMVFSPILFLFERYMFCYHWCTTVKCNVAIVDVDCGRADYFSAYTCILLSYINS